MPSREKQLLLASISMMRRFQKRNEELLDSLTTTRAGAARLEVRDLPYISNTCLGKAYVSGKCC